MTGARDLETVRQMLAQTLADKLGGAILTSKVLIHGRSEITFEELTDVASTVLEFFAARETELTLNPDFTLSDEARNAIRDSIRNGRLIVQKTGGDDE